MLTEDALYEMALRIEAGIQNNKEYVLLYSDEDKCDETKEHCYEPKYKPELNPDLILSNNYICHFMVAKREMFIDITIKRSIWLFNRVEKTTPIPFMILL